MPLEIPKFRKPFWNTVRLVNQDKNYNIPTRSKFIKKRKNSSNTHFHSLPTLRHHHRIHPQPAPPWRRPCPCTQSAPQRLFTTSLVRKRPRKRPRRRRRDAHVRRRGKHVVSLAAASTCGSGRVEDLRPRKRKRVWVGEGVVGAEVSGDGEG